MMRLGEPEQVVETFQRALGMRLIAVDATEEFLEALEGVTDPERKRKIIGERFVRIFEREAAAIAAVRTRALSSSQASDGKRRIASWPRAPSIPT